MPVQPTSLWAYETVAVGKRQGDVLRALRELTEATDQEIADFLAWTINRVTPRRGELVERELIVAARHKDGPFGHRVTVWRLVLKQGDLFEVPDLGIAERRT